jgi:branched-chain amino acid transport system ATP-binding protein
MTSEMPLAVAGPATGEVLLSFDAVTKSFGGVQAVAGLTMEIRAGGITGLIGPNGAGKTTIFNLATGFLRADEGTISFAGRDITNARPEQIFALGLGRSFQEMRTFGSLSVYDNLLVAIERRWSWRHGIEAYRERVEATLGRIGLAGVRDRRARELSYAERKLLTLGRIIIAEPTVLLLDEPASGLDDAAQRILVDTVKAVAAEGHKVVVIEHNLELVKELVDDVAFLNLGQLIAQAPLEEIIARPDLTELYFGGEA